MEDHNFGNYARAIGFTKNSRADDKQTIKFLKNGKYLLECVYIYYKFDEKKESDCFEPTLCRFEENRLLFYRYHYAISETTDLNGNVIPALDVMMIGIEVKNGKLSVINLNDNGIKDITYNFKGCDYMKEKCVNISLKYNTTNTVNKSLDFYAGSSYILQNPIISSTSDSVDLIFAKELERKEEKIYFFEINYKILIMFLLRCCVYKIE